MLPYTTRLSTARPSNSVPQFPWASCPAFSPVSGSPGLRTSLHLCVNNMRQEAMLKLYVITEESQASQ